MPGLRGTPRPLHQPGLALSGPPIRGLLNLYNLQPNTLLTDIVCNPREHKNQWSQRKKERDTEGQSEPETDETVRGFSSSAGSSKAEGWAAGLLREPPHSKPTSVQACIPVSMLLGRGPCCQDGAGSRRVSGLHEGPE